MPFDNTGYETFVKGPEGARRLARALRRELPHDFTWEMTTHYYQKHCGYAGCVIGLARHLGYPIDTSYDISRAFDMPLHLAQALTLGAEIYGFEWYELSKVTPQMVADAIDKWLVSINHPTSQE